MEEGSDEMNVRNEYREGRKRVKDEDKTEQFPVQFQQAFYIFTENMYKMQQN